MAAQNHAGDTACIYALFARVLLILLVAGTAVTSVRPADEAVSTWETAANIAYREGENLTQYMMDRCRLDLYYPAGAAAEDFPTVVWFHGGGLKGGSKYLPKGLEGRGLAVAAVNYRLSPDVMVRDCVEDAAAAIDWVFDHIGDYGGDPQKIFVSGHSAGGYLASMVGLDPKWMAAHGRDANDIAGLIPFSGHTITHFTVREELGMPGEQPLIDEMAPLFHVRADAPPILLITGDRELELLGRYEENAYFWRMMKVNGHTRTTLYELDGYDHGGMVQPAVPLLVRFVERLSREPR
jgi:acetyl esterase/lipase